MQQQPAATMQSENRRVFNHSPGTRQNLQQTLQQTTTLETTMRQAQIYIWPLQKDIMRDGKAQKYQDEKHALVSYYS